MCIRDRSRYVTWACYDDKDGQRQYEWGHYGNDRTAMEQDFADRVPDYQRIYNVGIRQTEAPGLYKYYSTQRPVDIGTCLLYTSMGSQAEWRGAVFRTVPL